MSEERVRTLKAAAPAAGRYVLYWMQINRRAESNHALAFATTLANRLGAPVLCDEELDCAWTTLCATT